MMDVGSEKVVDELIAQMYLKKFYPKMKLYKRDEKLSDNPIGIGLKVDMYLHPDFSEHGYSVELREGHLAYLLKIKVCREQDDTIRSAKTEIVVDLTPYAKGRPVDELIQKIRQMMGVVDSLLITSSQEG